MSLSLCLLTKLFFIHSVAIKQFDKSAIILRKSFNILLETIFGNNYYCYCFSSLYRVWLLFGCWPSSKRHNPFAPSLSFPLRGLELSKHLNSFSPFNMKFTLFLARVDLKLKNRLFVSCQRQVSSGQFIQSY